MSREITIIDLRNGDVFIKFGDNYAHVYSKEDVKQITDGIKSFINGESTSQWDNNEIEDWERCYESETTDLLTIEELTDELQYWNNNNL